jgi:pimeloyl-ACP methyl ester carboxylesterase
LIDPYPEFPRREVTVLGTTTSYASTANPEKPLVVLIHGMAASGDTYRETMHELASDFWLLAPDIPGFGYSAATEPFTLPHLVEWLAAFREALELPQMNLVGHSFGGALAASYTISYPEDVSRLLLVAPAILAGDMFPDALKKMAISLGLVDLASAVSNALIDSEARAKRSIYDPNHIDASVWRRRLRDFDNARANSDVLKALAFIDIEAELGRIRQPVRIIWGKNDPVLPSEHAYQIREAISDSQVMVWDECGHVPFLEKQEQFLAAMREFLSGQSESDFHAGRQ